MFSPDGRWVANQSDESGRPEIYVRPFAPPTDRATAAVPASSRDASAKQADGRWQVSTGGGIHPVWRPDGREVFYLNPASEMMAAPIAAGAGGGIDAVQLRQYDVAPDGRLLINTVVEDGGAPITIIQHWNPDAKK